MNKWLKTALVWGFPVAGILAIAGILITSNRANAIDTAGLPSNVRELARTSTFRQGSLYEIETMRSMVYLYVDMDGKAAITAIPKTINIP